MISTLISISQLLASAGFNPADIRESIKNIIAFLVQRGQYTQAQADNLFSNYLDYEARIGRLDAEIAGQNSQG